MTRSLPGKCYISFWDISLGNLPIGSFTHRHITPKDATRRIAQARQENRLLCVSHTDLLAPYRKRELRNHEALCRTLKKHFGIGLSLADFLSTRGEGDDSYTTIIPLEAVTIEEGDQLLIVTCAYTLGKGSSEKPFTFKIARDTVEFHLIESAARSPNRKAAGSFDDLVKRTTTKQKQAKAARRAVELRTNLPRKKPSDEVIRDVQNNFADARLPVHNSTARA